MGCPFLLCRLKPRASVDGSVLYQEMKNSHDTNKARSNANTTAARNPTLRKAQQIGLPPEDWVYTLPLPKPQ